MTQASKELLAATKSLMPKEVLSKRLKEFNLTEEELDFIHEQMIKKNRYYKKPF